MSSMFWNFRSLLSAAVAVGLCLPFAFAADDDKKPAAAAAPSVNLDDPAFGQYVDLALLGKAWRELDASLLTDLALQFAEGERVLQRTHKAISAETVFDLAVKTAAENRDTKSLDRLAGIFEKAKNTSALEKVSTAKKLAGTSRKAEAALTVSALETQPEQLSLYRDAINGIRGAGLIGDQSYFASFEEGLQDKTGVLSTLSDSQREHLKKLMGQTREAAPKKAESSSVADTLSKLKSASRYIAISGGHGYGGHGHSGHGHGYGGGGYGGGGYGGWSGGWSGGYNRGYHLDYHPGHLQPHNGHLDYVPGHYDVHRNSHWHP